ncbi:MAG TPA: hypothetical protein VGA56_14070 [Opitutaceae bacterium]
MSRKDFVSRRALAPVSAANEAVLAELTAFLDARIRQAETEGVSRRGVGAIFQQAYGEAKAGKDA